MLTIGPFVVGEIPTPLVYQFKDQDGVPIDLTGFSSVFQIAERNNVLVFYNPKTNNAVVTNPTDGEVTYTWDGSEFTNAGRFVGMFWVGNGSLRFASEYFYWITCLSVDTPPTI